MQEAEPRPSPTLAWLLMSGGLAPLALGIILALVGTFFVIRPKRLASMILGFLSLSPGIFGLIAVYLDTGQ